MADVWDLGLEIRFYSAWLGIFIMLCLLHPVTKQLLKRRPVCATTATKQKSEYPSQSESASYTETEDGNEENHKYAPFILSFYAFASVVFALIHLLFVGIFFSGQHFHITLNDNLCHFVYLMLYNAYNTSLYFYFMFMLYRIRIVFREPESLKLQKKQYFIILAVIHILFVVKIFLGCLSTFVWNDEFHFCMFLIDPTVLSIFFYVKYCGDSLVILLLFVMFTKRLCALTRQNESVNNLIKRTIFFGLLACVTSLCVSIGKLCGFPTEYLVNIDQSINCFCIAFSYKVECLCSCAIAKHYFHGIASNKNTQKDPDDDHEDDSDDGYTPPPDAVVLEEIFSGDRWTTDMPDPSINKTAVNS